MFDACLYFNANTLARKLNAIWDDAFKVLGLSTAHAYVVMLILKNEGITQNTISETLELKPSTVSRFIDVCVQKDLVTRKQEGKESRIFATDKAKCLAPALDESIHKIMSQVNENVPEKITRQLLESMIAFRDKIK